jgi:hypothetical protein
MGITYLGGGGRLSLAQCDPITKDQESSADLESEDP